MIFLIVHSMKKLMGIRFYSFHLFLYFTDYLKYLEKQATVNIFLRIT
jgi:hypothetical protein